MCIGDSITQGWSASDGGGYRPRLFTRAFNDGKTMRFVGSILEGPTTVAGQPFASWHNGFGGHTIQNNSNGQLGVYELMPTPIFDSSVPEVILLMIGWNDNGFALGISTIQARLDALLDRVVSMAPNALCVLAQNTPSSLASLEPDWTNYVNAIPGKVAARQALGQRFRTCDMRVMNVNDTIDGLHPTDAGYTTMGDVWYAAIKDVL